MPSFFRKPIFYVFLLLALVFAGVWIYYSNKNKTAKTEESTSTSETKSTESISNLTNVTASEYTTLITDQLSVADGKSVEVDKKNQLIGVEVRLPQSLGKSSGDTTYIYASPSDTTNNWLITLSNSTNNFIRSKTPKADYFSDGTAVNRTYWKLSYIEALQVAEKNGGMSFRAANTLSGMKLTLKNGSPNNYLYWYVEYDSDDNVQIIQIDADKGTVVEQTDSGTTGTTSTSE